MFQFQMGNNINGFPGFDPSNLKKLRNQKLRSWVIRQMFTGFFIWLLRDRSWIDIAIVIWLITALLSLSTILFLNKLIQSKKNNLTKNPTTKSDDDFVDVEVLED